MTNIENLPSDLRERGLFCCWRYEERNGKQTKVPYDPRTGSRAASNDRATFAPVTLAAAAVQRGYDGLGVGIFGDLAAIDIDHCIDDHGCWTETAIDVYNRMDCYCERSPSGHGLRMLFTVAPGFHYDTGRFYINNQKAGLEVYVAGHTNKYVTVTGDRLSSHTKLEPRDGQLLQVLEKYMTRPAKNTGALPWDGEIGGGGQPLDLSDSELLERAKTSKNGSAFSRLWDGDTGAYRSQSEADIGLCNMLAFWTGRDPKRMDRLFRQSGLMREKWDRRQSGSTYGWITIENAIRSCQQVYEPGRMTAEQAFQPVAEQKSIKSMLVKASEIPYEPPRWLIAPYFQRGKGTLIQADNGTGKTAFMCAIAAHVSTATPLMGIPIETPGDVLLLSVEDDLPVLRGRIEANGGDLDRCHFLTNAAGLTFNSPEVEQAIQEVNAKLVVFDPLQAFMGANVQMDKSNQTRPQLAKLFEMAARNDCSVAIISHMGKGSSDKSPVNRSLGSVDIPAAMRSIFQIVRNPDDEQECVAVHVKCSNAPKGRSIAYSIGDRGGVHWNGFSYMTPEDLTVIQKRKKSGVNYENEPLVQVFNQLVTDNPSGGFWAYSDLKVEGAKILGFPPFDGIGDLRKKLDKGLARELQKNDGLIVSHSQTGPHNARGIKVERYCLPEGYQVPMTG